MKKPLSSLDEAYLEQPTAAVDVTVDAPPASTDAVDLAAATLVREARASTEVMTTAEIAGIARVGQFVGMARYAEFMETTNRVARLKTLLHLKDTGVYKNVPMQNTKGEMVRPKNFEELCVAVGTSRAKVEEDARNLAVFGDKLLEEQKNMGIGYRELRALRAGVASLPEEEQGAAKDRITQAVESGDKTAVRDLLEDLMEEKRVLAKKLSAAKKAVKAAEDQAHVLEQQRDEKSQKANDLEMQLTLALNPSSEDERQQNLHAARAAVRAQLDEECNSLVGIASTLCTHIGNVRKADTEGTVLGAPIIDVELWEHMNTRVALAMDSVSALLLSAGLDVAAIYAEAPADEHAPTDEHALDSTDHAHTQQ